jgi:hypothetical protein
VILVSGRLPGHRAPSPAGRFRCCCSNCRPNRSGYLQQAPGPGGRGGSRWARRPISQVSTWAGSDERGRYDTGPVLLAGGRALPMSGRRCIQAQEAEHQAIAWSRHRPAGAKTAVGWCRCGCAWWASCGDGSLARPGMPWDCQQVGRREKGARVAEATAADYAWFKVRSSNMVWIPRRRRCGSRGGWETVAGAATARTGTAPSPPMPAGLALSGRLATVPGSYQSFYQGMARAILGHGPVPVPEARNTIWMIKCALKSRREGRPVKVRRTQAALRRYRPIAAKIILRSIQTSWQGFT